MILNILFALCGIIGYLLPLKCEEKELWMMRQDFVKIGKKDVYEQLQKEWIQHFQSFSKEKSFLPIYMAQDSEEPEYITLVSFDSYNDIELYFDQLKNFYHSLPKEVGKRLYGVKESLLNFNIYTLQRALPQCSYMPASSSFTSLPSLRYFIYSIEPGSQKDFEGKLAEYARQLKLKEAHFGFRVWRVLFGADMPKYLLLFSAQTASLAKQAAHLNDLNQTLKDIIRDIKQSHGTIRGDLSIEVTNAH